jgi:large subunit ribosomal protein L18
MNEKKIARMRRAIKTRARIAESSRIRLCINRTPRHIYAQIISSDGAKTLVCASSLEKAIKEQLKSTGNIDAATLVGKTLAQKAIEAGIKEVAFDRSGFRYHGRVRALADAAREAGLVF